MSEPLPATPDPRLDAAIAEYLEAVEGGGPADPRYWLDRYPDLADQLGDFFAAEARFDHLVAPLRATPLPAADPGAALPRAVAGYDLQGELGRGGMGVVYRAVQRALNRPAAVKMIRSAEWATPDERRRFRWEAEAAAALDHPNIVPIYEVGEFEADGARLPFFSMKLIDGENLSQARGRFRGEWAGAARLLALVARAVAHAHRRGVLHRDLKPGNILLAVRPADAPGEEPGGAGFRLGAAVVTPYVSDFGLARRAHQRGPGQTLPGAILGTPAYLSPELTRGHEFATSASDVYSLGAILYELLTGGPPFEADTPLATIRLVADGRVAPPRRADPAVPRDLETVCLKCLEPDPGRRYASADALADDLDRYLTGRPVVARPVGGPARFARWCRRQPVVAGLSAALILAALAGLPLVVWSWRRAVEQEQLARQRAEEARAERDRAEEAFGLAHSAVEDVFRLLADDRGDAPVSPTDRQLLANGLTYYRAFAERHRDDPKLRRRVADALFRRGLLATRIGPLAEAVESYQTAVTLLRALSAEHPDEAALRELLGKSLGNLGNALGALNRTAEAVAAQEEAAAVWAGLPPGGGAAREQARAWVNRGVALQATGDWAQALDSFRRGQAVLAGHPAERESALMAMCLLNVSQAADRLGHPDDALRDAREAARLADRLSKADPRSDEARLTAAYAVRSVGRLHLNRGDLAAAGADLAAARAALDDLHARRPRDTEYAWNLSLVYEDLAALAERQRQPLDALKALLLAEGLLKGLVGRDGESHPHRASLARVERHIGRACMGFGDAEGGRRTYEQARAHLEYLLAHGAPGPAVRADLAGTCHQLGVACARLNRYRDAATAAAEAATHYRVLLDRTPGDGAVRKNLSSVLGNAAIASRALRDLPAALQATEERVRLWPDAPPELYDAATDFARTFDLAGRADDPLAGVRERALAAAADALRQALRAGLADRDKFRTDQRLAPLRDTPEFRALLAEFPRPAP